MSRGLIKYRNEEEKKIYNEMLEHLALQLYRNKLDPNNKVTGALYAFSNESLDEYFDRLMFDGCKVLTVGSSGDQVLASLKNSASKITLIDGNPMSMAYTELKLAALKNLSFEEFGQFFTFPNFVNHKFYSKVSHDLSAPSQEFWDSIVLNVSDDRGIFDSLFQGTVFYDFQGFRNQLSHYTDEDFFNKAKKNLETCEIDFVYADYKDFARSLDGQSYDIMLLSNIADYVDDHDFFSQLFALRNNLNNNGIIQYHYDFNRFCAMSQDMINALADFSGDSVMKFASERSWRKGMQEFSYNGSTQFRIKNKFKSVVSCVTKEYLDKRYKKLSSSERLEIDQLCQQKENETDLSLL